MRRTQKIIFIVVLLIACFSAYSLAEMNQVHKLNFAWGNANTFFNVPRVSFGDWTSPKKPVYMDYSIITNDNQVVTINGTSKIKYIDLPQVDFDNEFLIFATLGEVNSDGYSIKVKEIAQRGNIIEVMVDLAQPKEFNLLPFKKNNPYDFVKVSKEGLAFKGDLLFIFKDYNGTELYRQECNVDNKKEDI